MATKIFQTLSIGALAVFFLFSQADAANVVPGTIAKGAYTTSNTCNSSQSPQYSPSGFSCYAGWSVKTPDTMNCACGNAIPDSGNCWQYGNQACGNYVPDTMNCACNNTVYYTVPSMSGQLQFTNYFKKDENPSFGESSYSIKLTNTTSRTCNRWADGTNHTPPTMSASSSCEQSNQSYYVGWSHGVCNQFGSKDNLISSFTQTQGITGTSSPSDGDASCTVEGLYATSDSSGPTVTVENGVSAVFDGDADNWCNMDKYLSRGVFAGKAYGSTGNPELGGCNYYRSKNPNISGSGSVDLLKGLQLTITDPNGSGISSVLVELGSCSATYWFKTGITDLLATSASTSIRPEYNTMVIKYDQSVSSIAVSGWSSPSLLSAFWVSRLDACLQEGKNFLRVTAKDSSRSDSDGISPSANPNTTVFSYDSQSKFIKVDNYGAKLNITGNARSIAESNTLSAGFVGGIIDEPNASQWKNFTISGSIKSADPFGNNQADPGNMCQVLTSSGMSCDYARMGKYVGWAKPSNAVWKWPAGVDPNTGAFVGYTCDGLGPIPDKNSCDWDFVGGAVPDVPVPTCTTPGSCTTPDSACPSAWYCPSHLIVPNRLFILFSSWSANASGPNAAKLTSDVDTSRGMLKWKLATCSIPTNATASTGYKIFKYSATGNYTFPTAPTGPFPIVENGDTMCMPTCNAGYRPIAGAGGGSCEQIRYRARYCPLASQTGPTLGYNARWDNPGASMPQNKCGLWNGSTYELKDPGSIDLDPTNNQYVRCDVLPDTMVDVNQPIPDQYCPATAMPTDDWWYVEFTLKKAAGSVWDRSVREFSTFPASATAPLYQCILKSAGYDGDGIGVCDITGNVGQDDWKITIRDEWDASAHKCNLVCNYKKYNGSQTEGAPCTVSGQQGIMVGGCCLAGNHWERGAGNGLQKNIISSCDLPPDNCPSGDFSGSSYDGMCGTAPTTPSACQTIQEKVDPVLYSGSPLNIDAPFGSSYFGQTATNIPIGTYDDFRDPGILCQYLGYQSSVSYTCLPACNTQCPGGFDEGGGCMGGYSDACTPVAHRHNGGWFASVNPIGQNYCTYGVKDITCQKKVNCPPPLQITTSQGTCYMDVEGTYNEGDTRIFACRLHSWDNRDNSALGTYQSGQWVLSNQTAWGYYADPYRDCAGMTGAVNDGTSMGWICPSNTPVPWVCGSAQYGTAGETAPTTDLCSSGTPSVPTGTPYSQYSWTCSGQNGGAIANCFTQIPSYGG